MWCAVVQISVVEISELAVDPMEENRSLVLGVPDQPVPLRVTLWVEGLQPWRVNLFWDSHEGRIEICDRLMNSDAHQMGAGRQRLGPLRLVWLQPRSLLARPLQRWGLWSGEFPGC